MKKALKNILLCIPIALAFINIGSVKAADNDKNAVKYTSLSKTGAVVSIEGYRETNNFYMFGLDTSIALCLDPGKRMSNGLPYKYLNSITANSSSNTMLIKAYVFAKNHPDEASRLASQVVVWIRSTDYNTLVDYVTKALRNHAYTSIIQNPEATARGYVDGIIQTNIDGVTLYEWEYSGKGSGNYQKLLTDVPGTPKKDDPCKIVNISELATCNGSNSSNNGVIYQSPSGYCVDEYTKNNTNYSGKFDTSYGTYCRMFCLQQFSETYPGNISTAVSVGQYIVWPNNNLNMNIRKTQANLTKYPLSTTLTKACKIYVDTKTINTQYSGYKTTMNTYKKYRNDYIKDACGSLKTDYDTATADLETANSAATSAATEASNAGAAASGCTNHLLATCQSAQSAWISANQKNVAAQANLTAAQSKLDEAKEKYEGCVEYGKAYSSAKSLIKDYNNCVSATVDMDTSYSADYSSSYEDPTYTGSFNTYETYNNSSCNGCSSAISKVAETPESITTNDLLNKAKEVESRSISGETTKKYDITESPSGTYYYYVNKNNNKSVHSTSGITNYTTIGFSNMPISYDSDVTKSYPLKLNASLSGTPFDSEISSQDYTCHYKVTNESKDCKCPEGTKHEGESIECKLSSTNQASQYQITCPEGIIKWCDSDELIPHDEAACPPSDYKCPTGTPNEGLPLKSCVSSGNSYDSCVLTFCYGPNICIGDNCCVGPNCDTVKKWTCPAGTNAGMDLTACVIPMILKGSSEQKAYEYCKDVSCPYKNGIKIIYRTIDLDNPFPGKNISQQVSGFNDDVKGRYPGSNWNSTTAVSKYILNNRGVDGEKVYNKEPLYSFTLTTATIKAIRAYNDSQSQGYADFTLKCLNNSSACVSNFIHNAAYGLSGGTCSHVTKGNFYTCNK